MKLHVFYILTIYLSVILYCFSVLRAESSLLKDHIEAQAKELEHRMRQIEELEEKERVANESVCYLHVNSYFSN